MGDLNYRLAAIDSASATLLDEFTHQRPDNYTVRQMATERRTKELLVYDEVKMILEIISISLLG